VSRRRVSCRLLHCSCFSDHRLADPSQSMCRVSRNSIYMIRGLGQFMEGLRKGMERAYGHDSTYVAKFLKNYIEIINHFHVMRSHDLLQKDRGYKGRRCAFCFEEDITVILEVEAEIVEHTGPGRTFFKPAITFSHESVEAEEI
jgi:hypothetical protein